MKNYELMTLTKGTAGESVAKEMTKTVKELIESLGGKVTKSDFWGKRKLAYKIRVETDGYYEVTQFEFPSDKIDNIKKKLNLEDNLVRYLITAKS